jgi:hypothetical protein
MAVFYVVFVSASRPSTGTCTGTVEMGVRELTRARPSFKLYPSSLFVLGTLRRSTVVFS